MRKIYGCLFLALFSKSMAFSQINTQLNQLQNSGTHEECRANHVHERMMQTDAAYVQRRNQIEAHYENVMRSGVVNKTTYTIPVVVHVIHTGQAVGTGANISDAQIQSAIDNLNDAYSNTSTPFTTYTGSNTNIQFCLAQRDPSGNPTTGIVRVDGSGVTQYSSKGVCDAGGGTGTDNETAVKALSKWDNTKYYNFWIVTEINDNNAGAGTQGYAYFPGAGSSVDGAIMMYNSFGYDPDGSLGYNLKSYTNKNVTAVHEVGHALNLYHTFQGDGTGSTCPTDAVCGTSGDCVADTPPHKRSNSDCLINTTDATCGNVDRDLHVHNFMDYSSDDCQTEFTAGQITRMNAVMTGSRSSLAASDGCNPVFTRDVGVNSILTPNVGTCGTTFTPEVRVKNYGSGTITSFTVNYDLDGGTNQTYDWTGTLTSGSTVDVVLSGMTTTAGAHTFNTSTSVPNGLADQYTPNDDDAYAFTVIGTPPTAASCSPTTTNTGDYNTGINRVQFNTLDHAHADGVNDGLQDFTCQYNTTVSTNTSYTLTVTCDASAEYLVAFIDYNDNGTFEAGELVLDHHNTNSGTSHSGSVMIPQYPDVTGKLIRMRIITNFNPMVTTGCADSDYGEIEDYSVFITTPPCVAPVLNSSPSDLVSCDPATGTFTCSVTGPSLAYQWQIDTGTGFGNLSNGGVYSGATTSTLTVTAANSTYNGYMYRCYISNGCGNVTTTAATLRSYASPTASCSPTTTNTGNFGTGIVRFQFNSIDKVHDDLNNDGTQNFTCSSSTSVLAGNNYAFTITGAGSNPEYARIFIDFNDNGVFTDAGEQVFNQSTTKATSHSGTIAIPSSGYVAGKILRMRVITDFNNPGNGCANITYGEVEDYGITITSAPTITASAGASRCTTGTLSLSASASAGFVKWYDAPTGGNLVGAGTSFTTPSIATTTTYYAEAIDGALTSASRTAVTAAVIGNTQIRSYDCGRTSMNFAEKIYCDPLTGVTGYRFEVFDGTNTYEIDRTVRYFYLTQIPGNDYNKTYTIRVKGQVNGLYGCYSNSCNVMTARPRTKLAASQCNITLAAIDTRIFAETRAAATGYRFKVLRNGANAQIIDKTENVFRLTDLPSYAYNTTYTVYVAYEADGIWGLYGAACDVTTPGPGTTQVQASQCGATLATTTAADKIYGNNVYLATDYRFEVTYGGNTQVIDRTVRYFYITQYTGWAHNRTYSIRVAAKVNGTWGSYGAACNVTTPASGMIQDQTIHEADGNLMSDLSIEVYPNPNSGNFTLTATHEGTFNIINEVGQLIHTVKVTKENNFETRVEGLESGVYFVTGTVNNEVITKKVMVFK
ncbi:MAG: GEVED domain-containing protein [Bacteroidota bacterium]